MDYTHKQGESFAKSSCKGQEVKSGVLSTMVKQKLLITQKACGLE